MKQKTDWGKLAISLLVPQLAGGLGALATTPKIRGWYAGLEKPFFNPPNWVFGPVWTTLYLLMGIALYLVWRKKGKTNWWWMQMGLNVVWSWVFFGAENLFAALVVIVVLWEMIRRTMVDFGKTSRLAAGLMLPYLLWVSFAILLNAGIWWLN